MFHFFNKLPSEPDDIVFGLKDILWGLLGLLTFYILAIRSDTSILFFIDLFKKDIISQIGLLLMIGCSHIIYGIRDILNEYFNIKKDAIVIMCMFILPAVLFFLQFSLSMLLWVFVFIIYYIFMFEFRRKAT